MDINEKIKSFIRAKGPSLPVHIAKHIEKDLIMTAAFLSELTSKREVLMTSMKVGSSKIYYLPGQESRLQNFASNLNEKDLRTFNLLKDKKVLRDRAQDPLVRVSLRQIKDFAVPIEANLPSGIELFWKYYLLSNQEAEVVIKSTGMIGKWEEPKPSEKLVEKDVVLEGSKEKAKEVPPQKQVGPQQTKVPTPVQPQAQPVPTERSRPKIISVTHEFEKKREESKPEPKQERVDKQEKQETLKSEPKPEPKPVPISDPEKELAKGQQKEPLKEEKEEPKKPSKDEPEPSPNDELKGDFALKIKNYFEKNEIEVLSSKVLKKNSDLEFDVLIPSTVGSLLYYCRAKKKRRINDSDIAQAVVISDSRKMPLLFLSTGEATKKTEEMLGKEFKSVKFKMV